jgi:transcription initiation factor IIE alpha subunit
MSIDESWLTAPCPNCRYEFDCSFLHVRLEETLICPCCKRNIRLRDADASVEGAKREIDQAMKDLESAFQGLNLKIRF